jgi:hypothetical protein
MNKEYGGLSSTGMGKGRGDERLERRDRIKSLKPRE